MSFFLILSSIIILAWFYIWRSTVLASKLPALARGILEGILAVGLTVQLGTPFLLRSDLVGKHVGVFAVTFGLLGFMDLFAFYCVIKDVLLIPWKLFLNKKTDPSRRLFVIRSLNIAALGAAGVSALVGTETALADPQLKRVLVPVKDLHPSLDGFTIAQISDLHIGSLIHKEKVQRIVDTISKLNPDLITITGDIADGSVADLGAASSPLGELKGKYGNFYVSGNHEYYWDVDQWASHMKSLGFQYLYNENKVLSINKASLLVGGVADYSCKRIRPDHKSSPRESVMNAPPVDFKLLCAHQPKSCFEAFEAGYDLQLSGHTHNGQFFPNNLFIGFFHPYVRGLNKHKERLWVYVSAGTGFWGPPQRLGIPAEITLLTLRRT